MRVYVGLPSTTTGIQYPDTAVELVMKLDQFRKMSEPWTWQTICDIQMLFDNGGNIETCDPFTFTLEAIDYDSQTIFGDCISCCFLSSTNADHWS